jgi:hypothetical protein
VRWPLTTNSTAPSVGAPAWLERRRRSVNYTPVIGSGPTGECADSGLRFPLHVADLDENLIGFAGRESGLRSRALLPLEPVTAVWPWW